MAHWRGTVEELAASGAIPAVVALDVDMVNMCGINVLASVLV